MTDLRVNKFELKYWLDITVGRSQVCGNLQNGRSEVVNHTQDDCVKCTHSKIGVLFSGGVDSALLAYAVAMVTTPSDRVDLLNVSFADNAPDRSVFLK